MYAGMLSNAWSIGLFKSETDHFRSSIWGQEKKSYQMNKGLDRNSATEMPLTHPNGCISSDMMRGSTRLAEDVRIFLSTLCKILNWVNSGSGFQGEIHWCEMKAALPMLWWNSTSISSFMSASCGLIFSISRTSLTGTVYMGNVIGISWKACGAHRFQGNVCNVPVT